MHKFFLLFTTGMLMAGSLTAGTKIKFATLAPEGSTWMNVMDDFSRAVKDSTGGELEFRIYPGGVAKPNDHRHD